MVQFRASLAGLRALMPTALFLRAILALGAGCCACAQVSLAHDFGRVRKDVIFLSPGRAEKLDLYLPVSGPTRHRAAVVWIHGGGWTGGTKDANREVQVCSALAEAGFVCASVSYRLGQGAWPENLLDCKNAVRYLRIHAAELDIAPDKIAVGGGSAGGHLALMVAFTVGEPKLEPAAPYPEVSSAVRCVLDFYGITDLLTRQETKPDGTPTGGRKDGGAVAVFTGADRDKIFRRASPVTYVTAHSPPVLILHGRADTTVDYEQSVQLAHKLEETGVPHELVLLEGVGHTFDLQAWNKKPLPRDLRPVVLAFLDKYLECN
jgi:acetyl esterase/lipase